MASQKGGQLAVLIGLIMSFFVIVILIFMIYGIDGRLAQREQRIAELQGDVKAADAKVQESLKKYRELARIVHDSENDVDLGNIQANILKPATSRLKAVLEQESYGGLSEDFKKNLHKTRPLTDKQYRALTELYNDLFAQVDATVPELNRLRAEKEDSLKQLEQVRASAREERKRLEEQIEQARAKYTEIENEKIRVAKEADSEKRRLLEEIDQVAKEREKLREDTALDQARLESTIAKLEERIRQMDEKKKKSLADTTSDGEIVHADQGLGIGWIDLGRKHRLRRGLTFEVFQYIKGGQRKKKGYVEVKRVDEDTAQVAVLSQLDPADPIVKGDFVTSPLFDKTKETVFVFLGDGLTNDRFEKSQLERLIKEFGGRVDDRVSIETDFIVALKNAEQAPEFEKAVQFGVVIMREADLLDFIGQ